MEAITQVTLAEGLLLTAATALGAGDPIDLNNHSREIAFYITGDGAVSGGVVTLETSDDPTYTGTWAIIGSPVTVTANAKQIVQATGCFRYVRARVSTIIVGGTVTVRLAAN